MEKSGLSLAGIQEVPRNNLILLAGPPGAGKSTFCHQVVLNGLAADKPVIFVTTEQTPAAVAGLLRERGMGEATPELLSFVDAFSETVGVGASVRPDTVYANCLDLNSISIAATRLQERMGRRGILLAVDSLTSPYLLSGAEVTRFMRLFLSKFAAEGNSVLALMDEGCGKEEDLVAMMSVADGIIKMEITEHSRIVNVVKHPKVEPTKIEVPLTVLPRVISSCFDPEYVRQETETLLAAGVQVTLRPELGDYVNIAWRNLILWSGMLWDPQRFPMTMYEVTRYSEDPSNYDFDMASVFPWHKRLLMKLLMPRSFSRARDMRRVFDLGFKPPFAQLKIGTMEYLDGISKTDEHYFRLHDGYECWGFENVGTSVGIMKPAMMAGSLQGMEELLGGPEREWNVVETKCIGLGDPYCEWKVVPGEIEELRDCLEKDSEAVGKVYERLMDHILGFLLHGKPLMERPLWGSDVHIHEVQHVTATPTVDERLRMVFRMGGARAGNILGARLLAAGLGADAAITRMISFMEHCKVGKITLGETIRMKENCERFGMRTAQPSCFFTTGFLNGLFSVVKGQHVRETRCIAAGDPYCEWEII